MERGARRRRLGVENRWSRDGSSGISFSVSSYVFLFLLFFPLDGGGGGSCTRFLVLVGESGISVVESWHICLLSEVGGG